MSDVFFVVYIVLLLVGAVLLAVVAVRGFGSTWFVRGLSGLLAAAGLGYAVHLMFFFPGGHYRISLWVFVAPVWAVTRMIRHRRGLRSRERAAATQLWGPTGAPGFARPGAQGRSGLAESAGFGQRFEFGPVEQGGRARPLAVASWAEPPQED